MRYRELGKTGLRVSEIGLGCEYLEGKSEAETVSVIHAAMDQGINILDCFMSEPNVRSHIGQALKGRREQMYIQGHFRSVWKDGQYARTLDLDEIKSFFEDLLTRLDTTYVDIGMIHMVDNEDDYNRIFHGPIYDYVRDLKQQGVIRCIGMSSHNPLVALKAVEEGLIEVLMFSTNIAYDLLDADMPRPRNLSRDFFDDLDIKGINSIRERLYHTCEAKGVGITVMKSLAAGALLDDARSPFGFAMTVPQCLHYCLTRPGVSSVMAGLQTVKEIAQAVRYEDLGEEERDYSHVLAAKPKFSLDGHCMYCNHCLPCPSHLNIAQIQKYLDLASMQPEVPPTVKEHYISLEQTASGCIQCGQCENRCPFHVPIRARMKDAVIRFGC